MVEKIITPRRNVIDFVSYQQDRAIGRAQAMAPRLCRHCGAALLDGENEDECSGALNADAPRGREAPRKFRAD